MANLGTSTVALEIIAEFLRQIKWPTKIQALELTFTGVVPIVADPFVAESRPVYVCGRLFLKKLYFRPKT